MVARYAGRKGRPYRRDRAHVLNQSDLCWWCGHTGAMAVDHVDARALGGANHRDNYAPIHGNEGCPVCPPRGGKLRNCNSEKGTKVGPPPRQGSRMW
jgi:hypothetical protein